MARSLDCVAVMLGIGDAGVKDVVTSDELKVEGSRLILSAGYGNGSHVPVPYGLVAGPNETARD